MATKTKKKASVECNDMGKLIELLAKNLDKIIELQTELTEKNIMLSDALEKLDKQGKDVTRANNRFGHARKVVVEYEASIFFKLFTWRLALKDKKLFNFQKGLKVITLYKKQKKNGNPDT